MKSCFEFLEGLISGMLPFTLLMLVGVFFTLKTKGYQFKNLSKSVRVFFSPSSGDGKGNSAFQSACNSLAATVGTGNIIGVGTAVVLGGAGAVFWMWVSALAAMCIKACEIALAIEFKEKRGKEHLGGPMYYIKNGLPKGYYPLSLLYAAAGVMSCFASGNIIQTNSAILCLSQDMRPRFWLGVAFAVITAVVIIGGVAKISAFTTKAVPFMSVLYILLCLGVIFVNIKALPECFGNIFKGAFKPSAVMGGASGSILNTVISGASKGIFSNEAGLGTAAMAYSLCGDQDSKKQSLYGIFEVFLDTVVLCTLTALTILCSGVIIDYGNQASQPVIQAFSGLYGDFSQWILGLMLCLFGISSIIGWAVYGIGCSIFLFGKIGKRLFVAVYPFFCVLGAVLKVKTVWRVAEFFNGIMIIINLFALLMLSNRIILILKDRENDNKKD